MADTTGHRLKLRREIAKVTSDMGYTLTAIIIVVGGFAAVTIGQSKTVSANPIADTNFRAALSWRLYMDVGIGTGQLMKNAALVIALIIIAVTVAGCFKSFGIPKL